MTGAENIVRSPDEVASCTALLELDRGHRALRAMEEDSLDGAIERVTLARRLGQILVALPTAQGRRDANGPTTKSEALDRLRIRRQRAAEWEALATLTDAELDGYFAEGHFRGEISMAGALRLAASKRRDGARDAAVRALSGKRLRVVGIALSHAGHEVEAAAGMLDHEHLREEGADRARRALERVVVAARNALRGLDVAPSSADIAEAAE